MSMAHNAAIAEKGVKMKKKILVKVLRGISYAFLLTTIFFIIAFLAYKVVRYAVYGFVALGFYITFKLVADQKEIDD